MTAEAPDLVALLAQRPAPTRLLALGEPMHGSEELLRVRNAAVQDLVLRGGVRSIAVESDFHRAPLVDAYLAGADVELDAVLRDGLSHPFVHDYAATRELLQWLREANRDLAEPVRFYGFDGPMEMAAAPSPREHLLRVRAAVSAVDPAVVPEARLDELLGDDAAWTDERAMYEADCGVGRTERADRLRLLADDLRAVLDAAAPDLAGRWWELQADARTAVGLLRYHAMMATDGPERMSRLIAQRDLMMAENLIAIADREAGRGGTVVLAHNRHLQREASTMTMGPYALRWFSAGALAQARLGDGYRFVSLALGAAPAHGLGEPGAGTVEGELYRAQEANAQLYDGSALARRFSDLAPRPDRDARGAYFPLDPAHLGDVDAVVFVREVRA